MATQTTNLGLTKPAYSDVADIMVINNNMDIIDTNLHDAIGMGAEALEVIGELSLPEGIGTIGAELKRLDDDIDDLHADLTNTVKKVTAETQTIQSNVVFGSNILPKGFIINQTGDRRNNPSTNKVFQIEVDGTDGYSHYIAFNNSTDGSKGINQVMYHSEEDVGYFNQYMGGDGSKTIFTNYPIPEYWMNIINNPDLSPHLVHRAHAETLTGIKTFYSGEFAPIRLRRNNTNFDVKTKSTDRPNADYDLFSAYMFDTNNVEILREYVRMRKDGSYADKWATFYDDNGVAHHPQFGLATRKSDGVSYAYCTETPADAPNNAIVTKSYPKMVTTDTANQRITSTKYFEAHQYLKTDFKINDSSTSSLYGNRLDVCDVDNARFGGIDSARQSLGGIRGNRVGVNVFGADKTNSAELYACVRDDGSRFAVCTTPSSNAPSTAIVNKSYVESTDGTTNGILHKTGNETRQSGAITFNRTSAIYDHGRVFSSGSTTTTDFYKYCTFQASGDLRGIIMVITLNSVGFVNVSEVGGSTSVSNLLGTPTTYMDFKVTKSGDERYIWVKRKVAGDIILHGINININGVRADVTVEPNYVKEGTQ